MVLRRLRRQRVRPSIKVSVLFGLMKTKPASMRNSATGEHSAVDFSSELTAPIVRSPDGRDFEKAGVTISTCCARMKTFRIQHRISNGSTAWFPLFVSLRFNGLDGYGWVFPKHEYICVGIGGRVGRETDIRAIIRTFVEKARHAKLIPSDLVISDPDYALDPAGAVHKMPILTKNRTILIGDAGGFVSGTTGEGIYPGMVSGGIAAKVVHDAMERGSSDVSRFNYRWREELGSYLRSLPGGEQKSSTVSRIDLIFRSKLVTAVAGRIFLYGER